MALNGWSSAQMLTDYGASERSARALLGSRTRPRS